MAALVKHFGLEFPSGYYNTYKKINLQAWDQYEKGLIDHLELRTKRFSDLLNHFKAKGDANLLSQFYLKGLVEEFEFMPSAKEVLQELHGHFELVYITNGLSDVQRPRLERSGIERLFSSIIIADEIGHQKPNAAYFQTALHSVNNPLKENVLVIGDNLSADILGGNQFGLDTCWYNYQRKLNNTDVLPKYEIQHFTELLPILNLKVKLFKH